MRPMSIATITACLSCFATLALADEEDYPKLGPNAVSMTADTAFLRNSDAPDYWAFASFIKPQFTTSACSIAAVTGAINGLKGLPEMASQTVMSQPEMLEVAGSPLWADLSAEGGDGVTFAQLAEFAELALQTAEMDGYTATSWQPATADEATLAELREKLAANEQSAEDAILIYFNQGVVTGDWDGPHVSVIGAYDATADKVLVLEVDQDWYIPYWTPVPVLLDAMLKPTSAEHGPLEGETGGFVTLAPAT